MTKILALNKKKSIILKPKAPYNFDANFHKPSHFPFSDNVWEKGRYLNSFTSLNKYGN